MKPQTFKSAAFCSKHHNTGIEFVKGKGSEQNEPQRNNTET